MRTRIKVCGVATEASCAALEGVDLVGFNFWPGSKRFVTPQRAAVLAPHLPDGIERVGLFVDPRPGDVEAALAALDLDLLQFHGDEPPSLCRRFGRPFMKAFRLRDEAVLDRIPDYVDGDQPFLVDAWVPGEIGGTGARARLELARLAGQRGGRMVLAGGLTPENVRDAIHGVLPWAVDVASGVERAPGHKDPDRVRAFVRAVREADGQRGGRG